MSTSGSLLPLDLTSVGVLSEPTAARGDLLPLSIGSQGGGNAFLFTLSPAAGQISADPDIARFTPITGTLVVDVNCVPIIFAKIGTMWWLLYDGNPVQTGTTGWSPFFAERSSITPTSVDRTYSFSILPNGGWWRTPIDIEWISGVILPGP